MSKKAQAEKLAEVVRQQAKALKPKDIERLLAHPRVIQRALAFAAETLADEDAGSESGRVQKIGTGRRAAQVRPAEAARRIEARTRVGKQAELLSSDELARRAGLKNRQSVHNWLKKGRVVGWSRGKRGYVFPAAQLDARGRPAPGLEQVLPLFDDGYQAWIWLSTPLTALEGRTPLSRLRKGELDEVLAAAAGDSQGDFA